MKTKAIGTFLIIFLLPIVLWGRQFSPEPSMIIATGNGPEILSDEVTYPLMPRASVGGTRAFAIIGFVLPAPLVGLATAAGLSEDFTAGTILGASAVILGGVGIPLVASAGARMRRDSNSSGSLGIIITGWALYGLAMANGVVAVGLSASEIAVPVEVGVAIAILGSASSILFGIEAMNAANDAEYSSARISTLLSYEKTFTGKNLTSAGISIRLNR